MKTEMEKCLAGEWYDCHAPVFLELKGKTHRLLMRYNSLSYEQKEEKYAILKEMFGSIGTEVSVGHSFLCDYGCNIHIGDNVTVNMGCVSDFFAFSSSSNSRSGLGPCPSFNRFFIMPSLKNAPDAITGGEI